jgi:GT2 family glycosyltransferase
MTTVTRTVLEPSASGRRRVDVTLVVVDYRNPELLGRSLARVFAADPTPADVVVVDVDPLEDLTLPEAVMSVDDGPRLRVATTSDNPGYSAACNRGADGAQTEWLLFMNSDVMVEPDTLGAVLDEVGEDPTVGIATPRLDLPDGGIDHACHRGIPSPLDSLWYKTRLDRVFRGSRRFGRYRMTWLDPVGVHDIEACTGAFLLIRRDVLEAVGGWDERYWFYAEDLDLCLRVTQAGWRVRYVGTASALHLKGVSSHLRRRDSELDEGQRETRRRVQRAIVESHHRFYREHLEAGTARPLRPLVEAMFALQRWTVERAR